MSEPEEPLSTDERVERSVRRTLTNALLAVVILAVAAGWLVGLGFYRLEPGQAAVLLLFGKHSDTVMEEGLKWSLPPPLVQRVFVRFSELRNEDFGFRGREDKDTPRQALVEATMQTRDNNIVRVPFAVQYTIKDPFLARFRLAKPAAVVHDAAQAAMREIVGRTTVDGVLRGRRAAVAAETRIRLQEVLDSYDAGLDVQGVQLQDVQPPAAVRQAFDDVLEATQDASRLVNEAEGYRNEVIPKARAEATEVREAALGYREAKIAEATGEAGRFMAIAAEYRKAPRVTQKRLYLETMESVLPDVDKVIIEEGTTQVLPYLPLGRRGAEGGQ